MGSPKAPPAAPDPTQTINAATAANKASAITNFQLNAVDKTNPFGSQTYTQNGTWDDGTPRYSQNTTLSPELASIYGKPFDLNGSINTQLSDQATKLLDPIWKQREAAQATSLANQGIGVGSEAYTNSMRDFADQRDRAYTSAALAGRSQAEQEALAQRNQPISEYNAVSYGQTPQVNVAPTDVAGITQQGYQNSLVPWQAQTQYNQALMGGLFGLGGAALGGIAGGPMGAALGAKAGSAFGNVIKGN
jgi:hypothetical protein